MLSFLLTSSGQTALDRVTAAGGGLHVQTACLALPPRGQLSSEMSSGGAWGLGLAWVALGLMLSCGLAQACVQGASKVPLALLVGK